MTARSAREASPASAPDERPIRLVLPQVEEALRHLEYGQVTITVQDGVVVQIERTERRRFQRRTGAVN